MSSLQSVERPISTQLLRASLKGREATLAAKEEAFANASAAYLENPSEETRDEQSRCEIARDLAAKKVREKEEELAAAIQREADPANRSFYDATVRERAAVEKWLRTRYDVLAKELGEGIARLAAVNYATRRANQNLPEDAAELDDLEYAVRRSSHGFHGELPATVNLPALEHGKLNHWPIDKVG
ncbi:hypothetical protein [Aureimonas sp. Leaf324]|uniref:hypothetical protein n=1 Tax=Aureimonas sp. Leaf324 TaxID=1736336 RepID=UPI0006F85D6F|nr:hypothetical protein [Aureimonas sp. Leaf324]KQQ83643.1 hypothetical protein ASF65_20475 [Aureimonas sp. Leaf324]